MTLPRAVKAQMKKLASQRMKRPAIGEGDFVHLYADGHIEAAILRGFAAGIRHAATQKDPYYSTAEEYCGKHHWDHGWIDGHDAHAAACLAEARRIEREGRK